jgi:hypothetical protein
VRLREKVVKVLRIGNTFGKKCWLRATILLDNVSHVMKTRMKKQENLVVRQIIHTFAAD